MGLSSIFSKRGKSTNQSKSNQSKPAEIADATALEQNAFEPNDVKNEKEFDNDAFWRKIARVLKNKGKKAVGDVLVMALKLYYVMLDDDTPTWAKAVIYGALAYFVVPIDLMPDLLPTGYLDDAGTLSTAVGTVHSHIKQEHEDKAQSKVDDWFGLDSESADIETVDAETADSETNNEKATKS